jgi:hypothetical protein
MKFDSCEINYCCGDKEVHIFRDCLLLNLKTFKLTDGPDYMIVSEDNIPEDTIIVDVAIANIVKNLNQKGYKTLFSCQGHFDKDISKDNQGEYHSSISAPYVMFEVEEFLDKYATHIFRVPRQFEIEICDKVADTAEEEIILNYGNHNNIDSSKKRIVIRSKLSYAYIDTEDGICFNADRLTVKKFNTYNAIDLIALTKWVDELPDLTKETTKQCGFDSKPAQEYKGDFIGSYNNAPYTIEEINEQIAAISDTLVNIGKRMKDIKLVEEIDDIDDTSMYESYIIRKNFPTKGYKEMVKNIKKAYWESYRFLDN